MNRELNIWLALFILAPVILAIATGVRPPIFLLIVYLGATLHVINLIDAHTSDLDGFYDDQLDQDDTPALLQERPARLKEGVLDFVKSSFTILMMASIVQLIALFLFQ
jgi:hypothetical protein